MYELVWEKICDVNLRLNDNFIKVEFSHYGIKKNTSSHTLNEKNKWNHVILPDFMFC